ncbi:MAG: 2-hydroxyacid dehydrogenase [Methylobacterium frigidaeris]
MKSTELLLLRPMMPLVADNLDRLFTLHRGDLAQDKDRVLDEVGPRIRGMAVSHVQVDGALLDRLPNLEIVANFGVGYDTIDAAECGRRGVMVTNTPDVLTDEVADLALGLLLATLRQIPQSDRYLRQGRWQEKPFPLTGTLRGRKVGILGLGRIGRAVAHRLVAFGAPVAYHGRRRQEDVPYEYHPTLLGLAEAVDVLIVVAPGGPETRGIVNREILEALGPEGVLVNVARGTLVDEDALAAALADGTIQSAGLDVFADEPRVPQALIEQEHTVLLPHVGSASTHTRNAMGQLVIDNLVSWFSGKGPVTPVAETPATRA